KKSLLILLTLLCTHFVGLSQDNHLSLIYDFEGADFDYAVKSMVGQNDSIYIIGNTPNGQGVFFKIDESGEGYEAIWEFDDVNYAPRSLMANDSVIYGTTRFSENGGGTLFKYSLKDYAFEFVADFAPTDVQEVEIEYITDSVLWFSSQWSFVDEGSIFTLEKDGSQLTKIYNDTNSEKGKNPVDFVFHNDSIYIACYNGGGIPYPDGTGGTVLSGSIIAINVDGSGYNRIVQGQDGVGTEPRSLIIREDTLYGLFATSGSNSALGGQFFKCNLDGSAYDSLGGLKERAYTSMLNTDSLIYGISASQIFGIDPLDGEIRIFDDLNSNPDFGYDVVANPAYLNGYTYFATQQGGPDGGGTILKWHNQEPAVDTSKKKMANTANDIDLSQLFTDPEGDPLAFIFDYNPDEISVERVANMLTVTPLITGEVGIEITANDGWTGRNSVELTFNNTVSSIDTKRSADNIILYPNPSRDVLNLGVNNVEMLELISLDGVLIKSFKNPGNQVDISMLKEGIYLCRYLLNGKYHTQKIVKSEK
ncbi:MAG: T9SS type A sorting domain-containing protein, partial [Bacteroidales bacterium]